MLKHILLLATVIAMLFAISCSTPPTPTGQATSPVAPASPGASVSQAKEGVALAAIMPPSSAGPLAFALQSGAAGNANQTYTQGSQYEFNTEEYQRIVDNPFRDTLGNPVSTFSIDVDTAGYANVRRYLMESRKLPPKDAVRIEEMINYFTYSYAQPTGEHPVAATLTMASAPWNPGHWLLRVAIKAKEIETANLPASNLVFLMDTSGSMADENKLPLLKQSLKIMVEKLRPQDRVSIVAYAGRAGLVLDSTPGLKKETILSAIEKLEAGGLTAGGEGIKLAYEVAKRGFIQGGNNRIILCTDGDFNVGVSSTSELERMIEDKRKENIYLTVIGVGTGNIKDSRMETLADKGNGNYAYIDNLLEGKKVFGKELWGTIFTVAKDVKIQIEFNPAIVSQYRLIGYENRLLAREDFNDDTKDAGEMGSGHAVTAFYELVPRKTGSDPDLHSSSDDLAFQQIAIVPSNDLLVFKLRYKAPGDGQEASRLISMRLDQQALYKDFAACDDDFKFASAVVEFGMLLRDSPYKGSSSWKSAMDRARAAKGTDLEGYRAEFVKLVEMAELVAGE
ncbi:MAG: vWA domain-containing protein [Rectinema subterraneum]|uniref:vWA domain-containing protein n=1 Tax=Rectinema subterraneum TaxID=2653714 RepID=UPI003C7BC875